MATTLTSRAATVMIPPRDHIACANLAYHRCTTKADPNRRCWGGHTGYSSNLQGVLGEHAFTLAYDADMDRSISSAGDGGKPDCRLRLGNSEVLVEVKSARQRDRYSPQLVLDPRRAHADYYCLVTVSFPQKCIVYPVYSLPVIKQHSRLTTMYGDEVYVMTPEEHIPAVAFPTSYGEPFDIPHNYQAPMAGSLGIRREPQKDFGF